MTQVHKQTLFTTLSIEYLDSMNQKRITAPRKKAVVLFKNGDSAEVVFTNEDNHSTSVKNGKN